MSDDEKVERRRCFFDITTDGKLAGRIVFELYDDITPKTCENFVKLCTGEAGLGQTTGKPLHYVGTLFHRVIKGFMIQGGDFSAGNGTGGESIYGGMFEDENFDMKHDKPFMLSMANRGKNTNGSQFFITTKPSSHLDGVHVVFGRVISGQDVVTEIEQLKVNAKNRPLADVMISNCGQLIKKKRKDTEGSEASEKTKKEKRKKKEKKKKKDKEHEEPEQVEPENISSVKPEDLPEEPAGMNKFLLRGAQKEEEKSRNDRDRDRNRERDGRPKIRTTRSGHKIKGRGFVRYFSPERFLRDRSETPPHWKREERRVITLTELDRIKKEKKEREERLAREKEEEEARDNDRNRRHNRDRDRDRNLRDRDRDRHRRREREPEKPQKPADDTHLFGFRPMGEHPEMPEDVEEPPINIDYLLGYEEPAPLEKATEPEISEVSQKQYNDRPFTQPDGVEEEFEESGRDSREEFAPLLPDEELVHKEKKSATEVGYKRDESRSVEHEEKRPKRHRSRSRERNERERSRSPEEKSKSPIRERKRNERSPEREKRREKSRSSSPPLHNKSLSPPARREEPIKENYPIREPSPEREKTPKKEEAPRKRRESSADKEATDAKKRRTSHLVLSRRHDDVKGLDRESAVVIVQNRDLQFVVVKELDHQLDVAALQSEIVDDQGTGMIVIEDDYLDQEAAPEVESVMNQDEDHDLVPESIDDRDPVLETADVETRQLGDERVVVAQRVVAAHLLPLQTRPVPVRPAQKHSIVAVPGQILAQNNVAVIEAAVEIDRAQEIAVVDHARNLLCSSQNNLLYEC
uniref:peptidylprolyl isomerase n=1 Tax=Acrobeloides nanus TaxID=290746 RepID=A0A914DYY1_9BILA